MKSNNTDTFYLQARHFNGKIENFKIWTDVDIFIDFYVKLKDKVSEVKPLPREEYDYGLKLVSGAFNKDEKDKSGEVVAVMQSYPVTYILITSDKPQI